MLQAEAEPEPEPEWDSSNYRKHMRSRKGQWERSLTRAWTREPGEPSQYNPHLDQAFIREMELGCYRGEGTMICDSPKKRTYYRCMCRVIGMSNGEETSYVYVEYCKAGRGRIHGYPITLTELCNRKRVRIPNESH
jgi:hypothetical protein